MVLEPRPRVVLVYQADTYEPPTYNNQPLGTSESFSANTTLEDWAPYLPAPSYRTGSKQVSFTASENLGY